LFPEQEIVSQGNLDYVPIQDIKLIIILSWLLLWLYSVWRMPKHERSFYLKFCH